MQSELGRANVEPRSNFRHQQRKLRSNMGQGCNADICLNIQEIAALILT